MNTQQALEAPNAYEAMLPYRDMLESALAFSGGTHSFRDVAWLVQEGEMQFWPAQRSCAVTQIVSYPQMRTLHVFLAAGDLMEIKDMDETFLDFARKLDCKHITLSGRKGWVKALDDIGFKSVHVTLAKEVTDNE
jgi:hypothetical protein